MTEPEKTVNPEQRPDDEQTPVAQADKEQEKQVREGAERKLTNLHGWRCS